MIVYNGFGMFNSLLKSLPVEVHIPGYHYCGPGTKLYKRLARGDPGVNGLDRACKDHDIAYSNSHDNFESRKIADSILAKKALERVIARDSSIGEKAAALGVATAMGAKRKLGMGLSYHAKKTTAGLTKIIKAAKKSMKPGKTAKLVIASALKGARSAVKKLGGKSKIKLPRVLPVPSQVGGALPLLIPLFAGLSATGALAGGAAGIVKAINDAKVGKESLREKVRHNKEMENIALGKGLRLRPYNPRGQGLRLKPYPRLTTKGGGIKNRKKKKSCVKKKKTSI